MKKQEIIEKLKELHDHSYKFMRYSELIREGKKDYLDKKSQIEEWIKEEDEFGDFLKKELKDPLRNMYYKDIVGKYLLRFNNYNQEKDQSLCLYHITDIYFDHDADKNGSVYFKKDIVYNSLGELTCISFKNYELDSMRYYRKTDPWDKVGAYTSTNHVYEMISEKMNGWMEIDEKTYEKIMKIIRLSPLTDKYNFNTFENIVKPVKFNSDGSEDQEF